MRKLLSLRNAIVAAIPSLASAPENLLVFAETGDISASYGKSDSHKTGYTASLTVLDYAGDIGVLTTALVRWIKVEQPELLLNPDTAKNAIKFEAELLSHTTFDLTIKIQLTERVIATLNQDTGITTVSWPPEPSMEGVNPSSETTLKKLYLHGELVAESANG